MKTLSVVSLVRTRESESLETLSTRSMAATQPPFYSLGAVARSTRALRMPKTRDYETKTRQPSRIRDPAG